MLYAATACLELHAKQIDDASVRALGKARDDVARARGKVQNVNSYLLRHIQSPVLSLHKKLTNLARTLNDQTTNFDDVFGDKCADRKDDFSDSRLTEIKAQLPGLIAGSKRLASALTSTDTILSVWTLFGAFLTALLTFGGWLYRTGDTRLTSIDVIASEIFSLCRAMSNNQSMRNLLNLYESDDPPHTLAYIELTERYDDFMGGVGHSLGFLDQFAISRVTGFYTSLKIARDRLRMLKNWAIDAASEKPSLAAQNPFFVKTTIKQIAYDFFLCLENARIAIHLLLEGDGLHDDCVFVCLLSEIRALSFLINLPNSPYIQERLHARLERPNYHTVEELESYLHPAFRPALDRIFDTYEKFYMDAAGLEIIEKLREQVYGNIAQRVMPRSVPDVSRLWRSIRNESLPVSRNMDDLLDRSRVGSRRGPGFE